MILLYLLLAVLAVISVLLLICLVRACIHKKSVPQTPLVRRENPDAMRIAGKLSKMVQVNTVVLPGEDNPHQFDPDGSKPCHNYSPTCSKNSIGWIIWTTTCC